MTKSDVLTKNVHHLIKKYGIGSVTQLSARLKMNQPTLHRMLTGEVEDPKYSTVKTLAEFFNVSVTDLMEGDLSVIDGDSSFTDIDSTTDSDTPQAENKKPTTTLGIANTVMQAIEPAVIEVVKHKIMSGASREDAISAAEITAEAITKGMTFMLKDLRT
ncbi:helix-turn-helix domain-containing protein [Xenorhabdus bovienii]|uniref:helix-turn-helix domain-containing protein n=1 Tax=Xenorhabdus bovienii TaxID=40576 RepID=UPI003DA4E2E8